MATSYLSKAVLDELAGALSLRGFRRRDQTFWLEHGAVRWAVHVAFVRHPDDIDFTIDVAVRHPEVEDRLNAQRPKLSAKMRRDTATVGIELGNWADGRPKRWSVTNLSEISAVANDAIQWSDRVAIPFLERFSSLDEVVKVLEAGTRRANLICPVPTKRAAVLDIARAILAERAT